MTLAAWCALSLMGLPRPATPSENGAWFTPTQDMPKTAPGFGGGAIATVHAHGLTAFGLGVTAGVQHGGAAGHGVADGARGFSGDWRA